LQPIVATGVPNVGQAERRGTGRELASPGSQRTRAGTRISWRDVDVDALGSGDVARLVEGTVDGVGRTPLGGIAVVQDAVDRSVVGGQQQVHDRQVGVV